VSVNKRVCLRNSGFHYLRVWRVEGLRVENRLEEGDEEKEEEKGDARADRW
jgi:hypothetical protein